ncbi:MAG: PDDEXK nuclease domain-containing protein [Prevotella sp.]|nr:PDDEXK nuclease domain-containing protein [Prevotella sp.]
MNFESLVGHINHVQDALQAQAAHAVNLSLTARNWLVGYYIVEYEQHGEDRAKYGEKLLKNLAQRLNRRGLGERRLYEYRLTYQVYPQLGGVVAEYVVKNGQDEILRLTTAKSEDSTVLIEKLRSSTAISAVPQEAWQTPAKSLFYKLSATHLIYLSNFNDELKRAFYEQETIRGCWTVTELDRQVSSQYYERMGLSKDKKALQKLAMKNAQQLAPRDILHNPVTLEFLGLESQEVYTETKLESYILNHLQAFLLEMGRGFCFEARQKRILVDQDYFKADLIFYHRILKCHVIIDLKIDRFRHEYASQLNLYMNYYKHEVMQEGDNPPIGLLLCTDYGETTVQYATEGLSQNLFVSKYRLQLPSEDEIRKYLLESISEKEFIELKNAE